MREPKLAVRPFATSDTEIESRSCRAVRPRSSIRLRPPSPDATSSCARFDWPTSSPAVKRRGGVATAPRSLRNTSISCCAIIRSRVSRWPLNSMTDHTRCRIAGNVTGSSTVHSRLPASRCCDFGRDAITTWTLFADSLTPLCHRCGLPMTAQVVPSGSLDFAHKSLTALHLTTELLGFRTDPAGEKWSSRRSLQHRACPRRGPPFCEPRR